MMTITKWEHNTVTVWSVYDESSGRTSSNLKYIFFRQNMYNASHFCQASENVLQPVASVCISQEIHSDFLHWIITIQ